MEAMTRAADRELPEIVASAASGNEVAFARIVGAYHGEMLRVCVVVARDRTIAEGAVQAAWLVAWCKPTNLPLIIGDEPSYEPLRARRRLATAGACQRLVPVASLRAVTPRGHAPLSSLQNLATDESLRPDARV